MKIWRRVMGLGTVLGLGVALGVVSGACGEPTVCDKALDKVHQCGATEEQLNDNGDACSAISACQANCILEAKCGDVIDAVEGQQNAVYDCATNCG